MSSKAIVYCIIAFILQLLIIAGLAYWYTLLNDHAADEAIRLFATNFPSFFQNKTILMITGGAITVLSMLFYAVARRNSGERKARSVITGLIFFDAIVLLLLIIVLF